MGRELDAPVHAERRPIALSWDEVISPHSLRNTGIPCVGRLPWGTHLCLFCETKQDLINSALDYFRPAPAAGEFCMWIASEPLQSAEALAAIRATPMLERWQMDGGFDIRSYAPGYSGHGPLDLKRVVPALHGRLTTALAKGFRGIRLFMNPPWRSFHVWPNVNAFERTVDTTIAGRAMIVLCAYCTGKSFSEDVLDVAHTHQCVVARRRAKWEFLRTANAANTKEEIDALNRDLDRLPPWLETENVLTERERVVLAQIVKGASSKRAARTLGISPRTVEYHRANAMQKLGAKNTAELVRMVLRGS